MAYVLTAAALKWSTIEKECYALVKAFNTFENLLLGRTFIVRTDHRNLLWMQQSINAKVQRWFTYLYIFESTLEHITGADNVVADALSRIFAPTPLGPYSKLQPAPTASTILSMAAISAVCNFVPADQWSLDKVKGFFNMLHAPLAEHGGVAPTFAAFKKAGCVFPHLKQQVIRMIADCPTCTKARALRRNDPTVLLEAHTPNAFEPLAVIRADFFTGLPVSCCGMTCILSIVCCFTRFTILYACPDQTTKSARSSLLRLWGMFNASQVLVTDGASAFVSEEFLALCNMLRVAHKTTLPHHPQAHSIVERHHRELDNALCLVVQAGLSSAEDRILTNYLRRPQVAAKFAVGDFVFITNTRPITQRLGKFLPNYCSPLLVVTDYGSDVYQVQDIVQDYDIYIYIYMTLFCLIIPIIML